MAPLSVQAFRVCARLWLVMLVLVGCSSAPPPPQIGKLPLITSGNAQAERDLTKARRASETGNLPLAEAHYRSFLERHANDPLVPIAQLELGKLLLTRGEVTEAHGFFQAVAVHSDPAVAEQGRFYGAVTDFRQDRAQRAAETLRPMVGRTIDPTDTSLLLATLAEAELSLGNLAAAVVALDKLATSEVPQADRTAAEERLVELIETRATAEEIVTLLRYLPAGGYGFGFAVRRAVRDAQAAHDSERTRELIGIMKAAGMTLDDELQEIAARASRPGDADPRAVGAILSLSGRARQVGELSLRGLMLAAGLPPEGPTAIDSARLVFRDDGGDPERAAQAVDELVGVHHVVAIVGPMNSQAARAAAVRAEEAGVPLIALSPAANLVEEYEHVFQIFPTAQDEIEALVEQAVREGRSRFGVLHPEGPFGETMASLLLQAVEARGAQMVSAQVYAAGATAFGKEVAKLVARKPDAILVADAAQRLALIAPALAAAGLWSTPPGGEPPDGSRAIQLLAPSVAFDHQMAKKSARYLQGALFTVAFDAATAEGPGQSFVQAYEERFSTPPSAFAALAHDAYELVRTVTRAGASSREEVSQALRTVRTTKLAGPATGFEPDGSPNNPTRLLRFTDDTFIPVR